MAAWSVPLRGPSHHAVLLRLLAEPIQMSELVISLALVAFSVLLTVVGALLGAAYQQRNWRFQNFEQFRQQRLSQASKTVDGLSKLIDRRLYRQRRLLWAVRSGDQSELSEALQNYREILFEWMDSLGQIKAELWLSFDKYTAIRFEEEVHDRFAALGRQIEHVIRTKSRSLLVQEERRLNVLGRSSYEFVHQLLRRISQEDLSGLTGRDHISFENWDNLSTGYLVKRLFGIAS
jgi:hypothetical protein